MEIFLNPDTWIALLTLTFLEVILGIDNIIFISIVAGKLPEEQRKKAIRLGLFLAMFMRIALLFGITVLIAMKEPFFHVDLSWFDVDVTGQSIILFLGGLFLIYNLVDLLRSDFSNNKLKKIAETQQLNRKLFFGAFLGILRAVNIWHFLSHRSTVFYMPIFVLNSIAIAAVFRQS